VTRFWYGLLLCGLAPCAQASLADSNHEARIETLRASFPAIDQLVKDFVARDRVPGAAWAIIVDGKVAHVAVTGLRDLEQQLPVQEDSVFRIASMTKSFTAMAILRLRDAGKLSLDDPAENYLPEIRYWTYATADSPRITIRHLLIHAAGLPEDNPWGDQQLAMPEADFDALLTQGLSFSNAPGVAYEYSNTGYALLGRIIARVSGLSYADYVTRNILAPLGMSATTLEPATVPSERQTPGYRWEDDQWKLEPQLADGAFGAMGGMLTSIADLARYVALFLDAYPARDGADVGPLSRASLREMQQNWRARPAVASRSGEDQRIDLQVQGYGYGLRIQQTCDFNHIVMHSGGLPGFGSQMRWLPEYGVGLIAFGNRTYTGWGPIFDQALKIMAETGALTPRQPTPSAALLEARAGVNELLARWDDAQAHEISAMNLFLDRSLDKRRAEFATLRNTMGSCRERDGFFSLENALRGEWLLDCDRGSILATVTLAPTKPARIQHLAVRAVEADSLTPWQACR
jgi:CubicO group peptidase (beta-lactamase class C family)